LAELIVPRAQQDEPHFVSTDATEGLVGSVSPGRMALRRFLHHKMAMISIIVLLFVTVVCVLAPVLAPYAQNERITQLDNPLTHPPSPAVPFGTDSIGRDMLSRVMWGGRVSLFIGIAVALSSTLIGTLMGSVSALRGGFIDDVLMRVTDVFLALPILVFLPVIAQLPNRQPWAKSLIGAKGSVRLMITLLSIVAWMPTARIVRGVMLSLKEKEFIEAARAMGAKTSRVIIGHLIPNAIGPIMVTASFTVAAAIGSEATLSFFGFGVDPQHASWGNLLTDSKTAIGAGYWWLVLYPVVALLVTVLTINFVGDGLRDAFDPKQGK
jgi:peptide/nickel transport system permease protein